MKKGINIRELLKNLKVSAAIAKLTEAEKNSLSQAVLEGNQQTIEDLHHLLEGEKLLMSYVELEVDEMAKDYINIIGKGLYQQDIIDQINLREKKEIKENDPDEILKQLKN
jgi:hypothetical protein